MRTEKRSGPSHVVAMRRSVERARMYSSISEVILKERDLADITIRVALDVDVHCGDGCPACKFYQSRANLLVDASP